MVIIANQLMDNYPSYPFRYRLIINPIPVPANVQRPEMIIAWIANSNIIYTPMYATNVNYRGG